MMMIVIVRGLSGRRGVFQLADPVLELVDLGGGGAPRLGRALLTLHQKKATVHAFYLFIYFLTTTD